MFRYSLVLLAGIWATAPISAASWADSMFEELSKDFGSVPHGPILSHPFRLTNTTGRPVHIAGIRVSCGCVSASAPQSGLAPDQSTVIYATIDTRRFLGVKSVTIYVTFDQPYWEEVRLWVQANSRDDMAVTPEALVFGQAKRGSSPSASVTVTFLGNGQWQIVGVQRESNYVQTSLQELRHDAGEVSYQVTARLRPDTPVGKWYSDVWLMTNNPVLPRIRVPLIVEIQSALSISPICVNLGQLKAGGESQRKVIVRGIQPFRITRVEGADDLLAVSNSTSESRTVHVLTLTFKPTEGGELDRKLKVITDLQEDGEIEIQARAQVLSVSSVGQFEGK